MIDDPNVMVFLLAHKFYSYDNFTRWEFGDMSDPTEIYYAINITNHQISPLRRPCRPLYRGYRVEHKLEESKITDIIKEGPFDTVLLGCVNHWMRYYNI